MPELTGDRLAGIGSAFGRGGLQKFEARQHPLLWIDLAPVRHFGFPYEMRGQSKFARRRDVLSHDILPSLKV